ncbi:tRNA-dihydrouridine synthase 2 [Microbotryomycetes sp. JL221]|nr:tRNA-dihydrouridine synthase 2 [Microbotryomycetes sp. JL221]
MVRIGTLPLRLVALDNGANLVWGPEIVDKAIIGTQRVVDPHSGTIRYIKNQRQIWETHPLEKNKIIFQLGSSNLNLAVEAAKWVQQDVAGIGLNCGCPKHFSIQAGMGAALLSEPDKLCSILEALVTNLTVPVDVKIRLFDDKEKTLNLVERLIKTGISALTVHCRTKEMRSSEPALIDRLKDIVDLVKQQSNNTIPVIANGDCFMVKQDQQRIQQLTGVNSVMIARGAEMNPTCFNESTGYKDPIEHVIPQLIKISIKTNNPFGNTKYVLNSIDLTKSPTTRSKQERSKFKILINQSKNFKDLLLACQLDSEKVFKQIENQDLSSLVPDWMERRRRIVDDDKVEHV